jgi:ABC-type uncharacterized transport system substrate-binding protein
VRMFESSAASSSLLAPRTVFVLVVDPVGQGFVQSLARPGGNITA